ncbi:hypothetical protein GCM10010840_25300 [Deinococcus aerolatus]|uniref:Uncharacterized protein n=1 Tax=Deinococcus aerolatus TaxID=522487 RepID=A0ABQ2GD13_9DEIO|nr:hypothetical protein GCM10010840_25300 [Deinococcus aerolatus]
MHVVLKKYLNAGEWSQLEPLAPSEESSAVTLTRELLEATARSGLSEQLGHLKRRFNPLLPAE